MNKTRQHQKIESYIIRHPTAKNLEIAKKFRIDRTKVWRIRNVLNAIPFNKKAGTPKRTSSTTVGFDGIIETTKNEITGNKKIQIAHAGGPIRGTRNKINYSVMGFGNEYDEDLVNNWTPNMQLSPVNSNTGIPLSASQVNARIRKNPRTFFQYSVNPLQSLDYRAIQATLRSTIGSSIFMAFVKMIVGKGFRPELELINPDEDSVKNQKEIDAHQYVIHDLLSIDRQLSYDESGELDVPFIEKVTGMILNMTTYNRGALIFGYEKPVKIRGKTWAEIPSSLKSAHPADMGIIKENPETGRLQAFQWRNAYEMVPTYDAIYLYNSVLAANTHNAGHYGDSMAIAMMDSLRVIRTNVGVNFKAMAEVAYAGLGILVVRPQGNSVTSKQAEYTTVSKNIVPAAINALIENPEDVKYYPVDYKPQVDQFVNMDESLIKYCVACLQLPHALFYDEASANRSCYSEDTLTLTESGWKHYNEIDWRNERIATLNPENGNIEYHYPDGISVYPYEGDMIHVKTKNQDILVTPDHDMWVSSSHDKQYVKFEKIKAEKLTKRKEFVFAQFGNWVGVPVPELYALQSVEMNSSGPHIRQQSQQVVSVKTDTWLQFMGYYLSEGTKSRPSKHGTAYFVSVSQNDSSKSCDNFKKCMDAMPFHYYDNMDKDKCHKWRFSSKQLVSNLRDTGELHDTKTIPRWMLQLQPKKLEILLDALMEGDGTTNKYGSKIYHTTSVQLARDVQELALKSGYGANLRVGYEASGNKSKTYRVFITKNKRHLRRIRSMDVAKEHYKGTVYCFSVKNHLFVTSRNGTVTVQGNTMIGKIQLTISTVINPVRGWIGRAFTDQWYDRWFRLMYKNTELVKKFKIKMVFEDLHIEEWFDKVEAMNMLESRKQLTDKAYGEGVGFENYTGSTVSDAPVNPGGASSNTMKIGSDKDGNGGFEIKDNSKNSIR